MIRVLNRLLNNYYFPIFLKLFTGLIFVLIIVIGLNANSSDSTFLKYLRNFNLANLIVWSYWWPIIIISAIFFGRIWCMICPIEPLTSFFAKIGFKLNRPKWVKSGWIITIFYILILFIGINGFAIHRNPFAMSVYLIIIVFVSIIFGLSFKKNTFCRYVCPVGHLLGLYSRLSFLGVRVKNDSTCNSCKDKSCINKKFHYNNVIKSCGVDLYPANITDNSQCILCGSCFKSCAKHDENQSEYRPNPILKYTGFTKGLMQNIKLSSAETFFILIVSGFVIYEIFVEWSVSKALLMYTPNYAADLLNINTPILFGLLKSLLLFLVFPLIIWLIPYVFVFNHFNNLKGYLSKIALFFIPIMAFAHLCKAILKTTSRLPYFQYVFKDVYGKANTELFLNKKIELFQLPLIFSYIIPLLLFLLVFIGIKISFSTTNRIINEEKKSNYLYLIPIIYGSIFIVMLTWWQLV